MASELTNHMNISSSNTSALMKKLHSIGDTTSAIKLGVSIFLDKTSINLPNNYKKGISEGIENNIFTSMYNMLPYNYVMNEFNITDKEAKELINDDNIPEFQEELFVDGKRMIRFSDDFIQEVKDCVLYALGEEETKECYKNNSIDGYMQLSRNKYITWYKLKGE